MWDKLLWGYTVQEHVVLIFPPTGGVIEKRAEEISGNIISNNRILDRVIKPYLKEKNHGRRI